MRLIRKEWLIVGVSLISIMSVTPANAEESNASPNPIDIVKQCDNKYPGEDQQSQLTITLRDKSGNERKTVYLRLWKDMKGADGVLDKMVLFTLYPPDAKGSGFMRWAYQKDTEKNAEQWIYLPSLRNIRRVSVRDLSDSFLGSDLTYGDITPRDVGDDKHEFLRIDKDQSGNEFYVIKTTPKDSNYQYSYWVSWYLKSQKPDECLKMQVEYYDRKDAFLKRQLLKWQRVNNAWVWEKVAVQNGQTFHASLFEVEKVKINSGIKDDWFTERRLKLGIE